MLENLKSLKNRLREDQELEAQFKAELRRIAQGKDAANDGEAFVKAAKAVGFGISMADLEKAHAETQELDPEELGNSAGGWCFAKHDCYTAWYHDGPDKEGTDCFADYDCYTIVHNPELFKCETTSGPTW